jgi:hypothetical protein
MNEACKRQIQEKKIQKGKRNRCGYCLLLLSTEVAYQRRECDVCISLR